MLEYSCNTEIPNLNLPFGGEKDVLGFQVSMQYLPVVYMFERQGHLNKPCKNLSLREPCTDFLLFGYQVEHIPTFTVIHDDAKTHLFHKAFSVADHIGIPHYLQHLYLSQGLMDLFIVHLGQIDNLSNRASTLMMNCFLVFRDSTSTAHPKEPWPMILIFLYLSIQKDR